MEDEDIKQLSKGLGKMGAEVLHEVLEEAFVKKLSLPIEATLVAIKLRQCAELGGWTQEERDSTKRLLKELIKEDQINPEMFLLFACCLDLIPPDRQKVAATQWTGRCPLEVLEQIQRELVSGPDGGLDPSSDTCWWLAARRFSSGIWRHPVVFHEHLQRFPMWTKDPDDRLFSAKQALGDLRDFKVIDGVAFVDDTPRCRNPYYFGHRFMVGFDRDLEVFTLATYHDSLGLEDFSFSDSRMDDDSPLSGLVDGSPQYARVSSFEELGEAVKAVRRKLG